MSIYAVCFSVSKSCTYWDSSTLQALHEHACLFYEKSKVDRIDKMPSNIIVNNYGNITVYDAEIKRKYSHLNQGSLTQCYLVNKDSLVESILKENIRSCVLPTGYLFCCNDVLISFIVQLNTQNNRYFMLTFENEQFYLLGPFSLNTLVKRVSEISRQDDCINDGKNRLSYSLLCSSALSKEGRKNIIRKFSNQRKREIYNKYNDHYLQLEPAKKKQRYSLIDRAKKELLETCAKKYKEIDVSKKKQMLENLRKKYNEMDASKKKRMLNTKAVKSRKSYDSMDCEKKEKYLNAIRNQSAIARQNRKISKLHVDVCISKFCWKIKEGSKVIKGKKSSLPSSIQLHVCK